MTQNYPGPDIDNVEVEKPCFTGQWVLLLTHFTVRETEKLSNWPKILQNQKIR